MRSYYLGLFLIFSQIGTNTWANSVPSGLNSAVILPRIKDIASIKGVRENVLIGYGLVVGLNGTGDGNNPATGASLKRMLEKLGVKVAQEAIDSKNVAAVIVTAKLPPFARRGATTDVHVSSVGDAKSLKNGTLVVTPLRAGDQNVYAVAQGTVIVGDGATAETYGRVASGGIIEREVEFDFQDTRSLRLALNDHDFTTSARVAATVNKELGGKFAMAKDSGTVDVIVPFGFEGRLVELMATVENLRVAVDTKARVLINERTGTIAAGGHVRVSPVAIAHGNLVIRVGENSTGVQNAPRQVPLNEQVRGPASGVNLSPIEALNQESQGKSMGFLRGATIEELVKALNVLGVTPKDLVAIFQSLKSIGALQADLVIM